MCMSVNLLPDRFSLPSLNPAVNGYLTIRAEKVDGFNRVCSAWELMCIMLCFLHFATYTAASVALLDAIQSARCCSAYTCKNAPTVCTNLTMGYNSFLSPNVVTGRTPLPFLSTPTPHLDFKKLWSPNASKAETKEDRWVSACGRILIPLGFFPG